MRTKLGKKSDKPIFKQIIDLIPSGLFRRSVSKHKSDKGSSRYFTYDQLVSTMFGQLKGGIFRDTQKDMLEKTLCERIEMVVLKILRDLLDLMSIRMNT